VWVRNNHKKIDKYKKKNIARVEIGPKLRIMGKKIEFESLWVIIKDLIEEEIKENSLI
jgi:hypothetical protein